VAVISNVLRHDPDKIDAGVVWHTATVEIEPLHRVVKLVLSGYPDDPGVA
jgi:hypothetical protein